MNTKMLAAIAAVGCAFALNADVTSQNVVGYSQSDLATDGDSVMVSPQFLSVGTEGVNLDDIKCPANSKALGMVYINTLYGDGSTDQTYDWTRIGSEYCWLDEETGKKAKDITFLPGQAFWVQCDAEDIILPFISAGEVPVKDIEFELATYGDSVVCGNATPVPVDIQDILCPATTKALGMVYINTLFGDGSTDQTYDWTRISGEYCWLDEETGKKAKDIFFQPGQGLWVQCDSEDEDNLIIMTFPGVELTK